MDYTCLVFIRSRNYRQFRFYLLGALDIDEMRAHFPCNVLEPRRSESIFSG